MRDLEFEGCQFTWERSRGTVDWVREKLDRILVTDSWLDIFGGAKASSIEAPVSDHLPLVLWPTPTERCKKRRSFKFENSWIRERQCREIVQNTWASTRGMHISNRLNICSNEIWIWGKNRVRDFQKQIEWCKRRLEGLRERTDRGGIREFGNVKSCYLRLLNQQYHYWKQRAKAHWLKNGDSNSKFYHDFVKRRKRNNCVEKLLDEGGRWVKKGPILRKLMQEYYISLFTSSHAGSSDFLNHIPASITSLQNSMLTRSISQEEAKSALFSMHPDKSPGPDGLNPGFYQAYWDVVGSDIVTMCNQFLQSGQLQPGLNETNLVLIPKVAKPQNMGDLRPIALCNVMYKILTKILANRLKSVLGGIILENQSAFIPGRSITDNVIVAFETQHFIKRKRQGKDGWVAVKADMSKAYDRVEWDFLRGIMIKMGFCNLWVDWIMACITTVKLNILVNGEEIGHVIPERGLRQGDPISPYLFILVTEGLSALIKKTVIKGELHGINVARNAQEVTHLLFADDSYFYFKAVSSEAHRFKNIMDYYSAASGQEMNLNKSSVIFSPNVKEELREELGRILGVRISGAAGNYLGLPEMIGRNKTDMLGFIKQRMINRIHGWGHRFLSRGGREILLKSVIQAIPSYTMGVFLLPKKLVSEVEAVMNAFWWKGEWGRSMGLKWKSWDKLCVPKKWGGLGFRKMREFNISLLCRQAWNIISNPSLLATRVLKARYYPNSSFLEAGRASNPSYIWSSMQETKEIIRRGSRWRVGNGRSISIWKDKWLPEDSNDRVITPPFPLLENATVDFLINVMRGNGIVGLLRIFFIIEMRS